MQERINIIPIICNILDKGSHDNEYNIRFLSEIQGNKTHPVKFQVGLLTCTNFIGDIEVQLLLRHIESDMSLDMGIVNMNIESDLSEREKNRNFLNIRHFIDVETTFPQSGKYVLDVFLLKDKKRIDFYSKEGYKELPISSVDITVK